jgi:hypothetical protein
VRYCEVQCGTVRYSEVQWGTVRYSEVQSCATEVEVVSHIKRGNLHVD